MIPRSRGRMAASLLGRLSLDERRDGRGQPAAEGTAHGLGEAHRLGGGGQRAGPDRSAGAPRTTGDGGSSSGVAVISGSDLGLWIDVTNALPRRHGTGTGTGFSRLREPGWNNPLWQAARQDGNRQATANPGCLDGRRPEPSVAPPTRTLCPSRPPDGGHNHGTSPEHPPTAIR